MKKLTAILLVLLLTASLFAGCQNEKTPDTTAAPAADSGAQYQSEAATTAAPVTDAPATEAPATEAPATEAPATEALEPVDVDGAQLLKDAAEKMKELKSLRFAVDLNEEITSEGFTIGVAIKTEGAHTAEPNATYQKGSMEMFGMEIPVEEYRFVQGDTLVTYSYDMERESFLRSESELEEEETDDEELDYSTLETSTAKDGSEYVVTVNSSYEQAGRLMKLGAGILAGSEATEMLPDFSDDEQSAELMGDMRFPVVFRIDEASGRITGFVLDLSALFDAMLEVAGQDTEIDGQMKGKMEVRYSDFDSVEPIEAPTEFIEDEPTDWDEDFDFDWDEDEDESGTEAP